MKNAFKLAVLFLVFLVEMAMFFSYGFTGYKLGYTDFQKFAQLVILPAIAITLWGIFAAPKSKRRLNPVPRMIFALILYTIGAWLLFLACYRLAGIALVVAGLMSEAFLFRNPISKESI